ncbi:Gldg family protein [Maribacter sp. 2210JD10-5]|uniref:Gldg family protein n=1 Tax=Maribacter sp. 2210JD10-5 TaxID=3386272 RepID=UPI0039BCE0BD
MKTILRIARFELSTLFYSPIAWLVLVIFIVQSSFEYHSSIDTVISFFKFDFPMPKGFTFGVFSDPNTGFFDGVLRNTFLYIPLLTMGLISKEISSGSIKLVLSSPVKAVELVLGKYFAIVAYILIMVIALLLYLVAAGFSIENADYGLITSAIIAFFLLASTYAAIGLFISCLTSYQVIAAIGTLFLLGVLSFVGTLGQGIPIIEDLTYWLSISGRAGVMVEGLISSADVLYFIIIICMFLAFATFKIASGRKVTSKLYKAMQYVLLFGAVALVAYISSLPSLVGYIDTSKTQYNTLTKNSEEIVKQIEGDLKITSYVNVLDGLASFAMPEGLNNDKKRFENFQRYIPQMQFEYVYFYDTIVGGGSYLIEDNPGGDLGELSLKALDGYGVEGDLTVLTPEEIKERVDLSKYGNRFVRQLSYKDKVSYLSMFNDMKSYPDEQQTSAAMKLLLEKPSEVVFTKGHGERNPNAASDRSYGQSMTKADYRYALIHNGFNFSQVDLSQDEIPGETDVLVIADPTTAFTEEELFKIKMYLGKGGNALVLAEPQHREVLLPLADHLGVTFVDGQLQQDLPDFEPEFVLTDLSPKVGELSKELTEIIGINKISQPTVMGLEADSQSAFKASPIFVTDATNTKTMGDSIPERPIATATALLMTKESSGKKQQRIIFSGDADWLSNMEYNRQYVPSLLNNIMATELFGWLVNNNYPIDTNRPAVNDLSITLDSKGKLFSKIILMGIVPGIVLVMGILILMKRRKN